MSKPDSQVLEEAIEQADEQKRAQRSNKKKIAEEAKATKTLREEQLAEQRKILKQVIEIAIANGWDYQQDVQFYKLAGGLKSITRLERFAERENPHEFIFRHDFAQALFGEELLHTGYGDDYAWRHHLKAMVISPSPIQYLRE